MDLYRGDLKATNECETMCHCLCQAPLHSHSRQLAAALTKKKLVGFSATLEVIVTKHGAVVTHMLLKGLSL